MQPHRQCNITGKRHGTHICVPYKPAGKFALPAKWQGMAIKIIVPQFYGKTKTRRPLPRLVFIKRRRKTERLAVSCNETEPTPLQADALPSDPAGRSGIPLLYRTTGVFFAPVLSFDAYIVHDFCRNFKGLWCTMCCKIYV